MNEITLEAAAYYEPRIRKAALETGCRTLHEDADRLQRFIEAARGNQARIDAQDYAEPNRDTPVCWPC